jgi:STE24 endopeptidase
MQKTEPKENYEYDTAKRTIASRYENAKLVLDSVNGTLIPIAFSAILLVSGGSVLLSGLLDSVVSSYWISLGLYLVVFVVLLQLVAMPLSFYSGFVVDHRFGLSTQTIKGWFVDEVKGLGVELVFGILAGTFLYYLIGNFTFWWLAAAVLFAVFSVFLSIILPFVILPIFYKVMPLSDLKLKDSLLQMSRGAGVENIDRVLVADESRKSVRANAFFSGVGKSRSIVLFDTLLNNFTPREIVTVVAHELGHYVNKDIWKEALTSGVLMIPPFFIADYALRAGVAAFGLTSITDPAGVPLIFLVLIGVSFVIQPVSNGISRIVERKADEFALRSANDPDAQASAEKRLADLSLGVDSPNRLVELFFYTHPPSSRRIRLAEDWGKSQGNK